MFIIYKPFNQREARQQFKGITQWFLDNPKRRVCNTELGKVRRSHIEEDILEFCQAGVTLTSAKKKARAQSKPPIRKPTNKPKDGRYQATYFGAECQANPGSSFQDYQDDIAYYYNYKSWDKMPAHLKAEATECFREGRAKEKKHQR